MSNPVDDSREHEAATPFDDDDDTIFDITLTLPFEPVRRVVELFSVTYRTKGNVNWERHYYRTKLRGRLTLKQADWIAVRLLGEHPATIWGEDYFRVMRELDLRFRLGNRRLGPPPDDAA